MEIDNKRSVGLRYASLASQMMIMLLLAVWAGHKIDKITNWKIPLFLILFPLISLSLSLWQLTRELNRPKK
jgi:F0F1-type ATP synthase assembly protein I